MTPRPPLLACLTAAVLAAPLAAQDTASLRRQLIAQRDAKQREMNALEQRRLTLQSELAALRKERAGLGEDADSAVSMSEALSRYQSRLQMLQHRIDLKLAEKNEFAVEYGRSTAFYRWILVTRLIWSSPSWNARYEKYVGGLRKAKEALANERKLIDQEVRAGIPGGGHLKRFGSEHELKRFLNTYYADPTVDPASKDATRLRMSKLHATARRAGVHPNQLVSRSGFRVGGHITRFSKGLDGLRHHVKWATGTKAASGHDFLPNGLGTARERLTRIERDIAAKEAEHARIVKRVAILAGEINSLNRRIQQLRDRPPVVAPPRPPQPTRPPRVTCQVADVSGPAKTRSPGAYRWTFQLVFLEMNGVPCRIELVRRTRLPRPLQAEPDNANWRHIAFNLVPLPSGRSGRKVGPESLTLPAPLKFKGSYEATFRVTYDRGRKRLPQPIVVKWYPSNLPTVPAAQPQGLNRTITLSGRLSPKLAGRYTKDERDPDPSVVNYKSSLRGSNATVTLRPDGTAHFSGIKVVYFSRQVDRDNGREITITIQPGRGKVLRKGDAASGKATGTYVEHEWRRQPFANSTPLDRTHTPVTKSIGWSVAKQRDGTYTLRVGCPKRMVNTYTLVYILRGGGQRR